MRVKNNYYIAAGTIIVSGLLIGLFMIFGIISPLTGAIIAGGIVTAVVSAMLARFFIYRSLGEDLRKLADSTTEALDSFSTPALYGVQRNDVIGEIARAIQHMRTHLVEDNINYIQTIQVYEHQEHLLKMIDSIIFSLLDTPSNDLDILDKYLLEGLNTISLCGQVNAIGVYRNEYMDNFAGDSVHAVSQLYWANGTPIVMEETGEFYNYDELLDSYNQLSKGIAVNKVIDGVPQKEKYFHQTKAKSLLIIPVTFQERFWGCVLYEDHLHAEAFHPRRIALLKSAALILISAVHRKGQITRINETTQRMRIMLDAMPISCYIWDSRGDMIDANNLGVKFFGFKSRSEAIARYNETVPEFQPDGQRSDELITTYRHRVLKEGQCRFEWTYRIPSTGELIPCEMTMVRINYHDKFVISGYMHDLREHRNLIEQIEHRGHLLYTVNSAANILLQAETEEFEGALFRSLSMMARAVNVGRIFVWAYHQNENNKYFTQIYEWMGDLNTFQRQNKRIYNYKDAAGIEAPLLRGLFVSGHANKLSDDVRDCLQLSNTLSYLMIPVFLQGKMWGLVGFGDMRSERDFSESDESILRSGGLLVANALLRNDMTRDIKETATKLQAVITNYTGIIWSVDSDEKITLFDGLTMSRLGIIPEFYEGKYLNEVPKRQHDFNLVEHARKTFKEGPQAWTVKLKDYIFSARTAPVYDTKGNITNIVGSIDDVTTSIELQERLETALYEAQSANRAKSNFLSTMSHEMRTPMNAIIGMTNIGSEAKQLERKDYAFERISAASNHLLGVINDVLDMSKIEAGMLSISNEPINLDHIISKVIDVSTFLMEEKSQRFEINISSEIPTVIVIDSQRLSQVLTNLISNAAKFTPEKREIRLEARLLDKNATACKIQFDVIDQGVGVSKEHQSTLFESFVQAEASTARKFGGTGLGLAISKHIVELMGGEIWIESELDKGATFSFTIIADIPSEDELDNIQCPAHPSSEVFEFPGRTLLLAEDIDINREIILAMFENTGLKIICAENGEEALRIFSETPEVFDLIFMDVHMPLMDGYEATRKIRALPHACAATIPIIAMTANVFREDIEKCLESGMDAHLGKPLDFEAVRDTLKGYSIPANPTPPPPRPRPTTQTCPPTTNPKNNHTTQ
ncbi:MAG: ATP-binding protein, partial [Defluviitaleaceae bacterium]|nr:ATP-binding protein [Defluviitaleaceae bacterium]